jgi:hypothetical protein
VPSCSSPWASRPVFWLSARRGRRARARSTRAGRARDSAAATAPAALAAGIAGAHADGSSATTDPLTHAPYEYERLGATHYRLCATFARASEASAAAAPLHRAGRSCYRVDLRSGVMELEGPRANAVT